MKLIGLIILVACLHVSAAGIGQNVTLSVKNASLKMIFNEIIMQSGTSIVYNDASIINARPVTIDVKNATPQEVLDLSLKGQPFYYTQEDGYIIIKPASTPRVNPTLNKQRFSTALESPPIKISGTVVGLNNQPLSGATIRVKGKNIVTTSDESGYFELNAEEGSILIVSYVGFYEREFKVRKGEPVQIELQQQSSNMDTAELVISTGYQKINKANLTGSVVTVSSRELEKRNATNILQNLEGTVPGLVQYRGVATIRGVSTIQANTNILVVVDGLPIEGSIADVNPYDVESISVLKDAAAASIYGARASNGVIVIVTKKANQRGKTAVEVSGNLTYTNKPDYSYQNYMTPAQQVEWESNYYKWWFDGGDGTVANPITDFENSISLGSPIGPVQYAHYRLKLGQITQAQLDSELGAYRSNDFAGQFREHALLNQVLQQYNIALRTNNGKTQNSLVVNYTTDNAAIINAFNRKLNLFYKGTYSPRTWLDLDYGVNSVIGKIRSHNNTFAINPFNVPSYYTLFNPDGTKAYYNTNQFNSYNTVTETTPALFSAKFNHLDELGRDFVNTSSLNTRYFINLSIKPLRGLTINPMFQYEDNRSDISTYSEAESYTMRWLHDVYTTRVGAPGNYTYTKLLPAGGKLASSQLRSPNYTGRVQANYDREFNKHKVMALAGAEFRQTRIYGRRGILLGYDEQLQTQSTNNVNFQSLFDISTGTFWNPSYPTRQLHFEQISDIGLVRDEMHRFASGYANLTYTYNRKYNLFGSLRKDYADLFGGDEKYRGRPLWSVGASWIASNEEFFKLFAFLNYLKVRASYGLTGNIRNVTALLAATTGVNNTTQLPNASVTNPPNPLLRWEKTATTNVGLDFSLLDNRLRGNIDLYRRKGTDLFAQKRLDPSEGFTSMVINNASMINNGFEFNLGYEWIRPSKSNGLRWSSSLMGAWNKNKITNVDELTRNPLTLASGGSYKVGYPVRSIFSFRFAGLNDLGVPQWYDSKANKTTASLGPAEADAILFSGDSDPRRNLSFNNDFSFKGITLSVFAVYYGGHYFRARQVPVAWNTPTYSSLPSYYLDSWTPTNTHTDIPGVNQYYQVPISNQYYYSDNLVRPADFIKIRNIVLAYDLPATIASNIKASNLRVRFQVNNPKSIWIRQKDVHVDPETGGAPIPTSFVFGINANF